MINFGQGGLEKTSLPKSYRYMKKQIMLLTLLLTVVAQIRAEVKMPRLFTDGMVLQRDSKPNLWGTAKAGATVKIRTTWNGKTVETKAGKDGKWKAQVETGEAGGPYEIVLSDGQEKKISNVLIGEVWVCSGQSNMEMTMEGYKGQVVEGAIVDLMESKDEQLRLFTVGHASKMEPQDDVEGEWQEAEAKSVRKFSACAYYFGRQLRRSLGVPVGLISASWGGSSCEAWMAKEWLKEFPETDRKNNPGERTYVVPEKEGDIKSPNRTPTVLYNGMLHPIIGYTMKGVIWYQGEDNIPRYKTYAKMQKKMIEGWRSEWKQGDFPFEFCQIAPYDYNIIEWKVNSALLREQQQIVEKTVKNTNMIVLLDAGLQYCIHPKKKRTAGERLAMHALADAYGMEGLSKSAWYEAVEFRNDTAVISFDRSRMWVHFENGRAKDNFEVAGEDRVFHKAQAWVYRNRVYVVSREVKQPKAVRYAFHNWVEGDLRCDGLPVSSFRTDDWDDEADVKIGKEYDIK